MSLLSNNIDNTKYDIYNFLEDHTVLAGQTYTHTSMYNPKGCYYIKQTELETFYELYEEALFNNRELHITEKHEEISPIVIDLDFKYELETFERKHTDIHIKKIIDLYLNEICAVFDIEKNDKRLTSFVFQRNELYKIKGITKDGIHILFPFIVSTPNPQYYIRENILKKIGDIVSDLGLKNIMSDVVDRSIIAPNTCWLLYGSNKDKPKGNPYKLSCIFDCYGSEIPLEKYFDTNDNINLARFFSIRNRKMSDLTSIKEDKVDSIEQTNKKKNIKIKSNTYVNYDHVRIRELVSILNPDRADNYTQWIEVGWVLHNIDPHSEELLNIWIDFSKKSAKYEEGCCERIWEKSKMEGLTIATLHYWAKIDNYSKYTEFKNHDINKFIDISVKTQSNYDIANVLYKMYEYDFVYCENEWYMYKNHLWHRESDGMSLRQKISTELCDKYFKIISHYNVLASSENVLDEEKEEYKKKGKEVLEIVKKLKTTSFKENVMKECKELFSQKEFIKKIDTNPYLIGFNNGVYDLKKGELRDGRPDDYIEISTEIDKIDFSENNEHWEDLKHFIDTVFFEEDVRNYFMMFMASCLQGHNAEEKFRIWIGVGCHAYDSLIMMSDGTSKKVQDIIVGDRLMGDDSTPRNVMELKRGFSDMYEITLSNDDKMTVNGEHVLCLKGEKDNIIEMKVNEYLKLENPTYLLYKTIVKFDKVEVPVDPYLLGCWLAGNKTKEEFNHKITNDMEIEKKYIPDIYKYNDVDTRVKIFAGLIDSNEYYMKMNNSEINQHPVFEVQLENERLIDDIIFISKSIGFPCKKSIIDESISDKTSEQRMYRQFTKQGDELETIVQRKRIFSVIFEFTLENKTEYSFSIKKVKDDHFYGFELDGNHRYIMGDFTVTHNSNGKSKILELFVHAFGNYTIKFPITLLTGKRAASNACTPEILQSKGKRFGYFEEPSENERINTGILKEFTGGDKIKTRGLHKDPIEFKPQFKTALLCNDVPKAPPNDTGYWRRTEVIEFKSRFCENPKESFEFPIDKNLSEKMKNWKELFMALLLDVYYERYKKEGIKVPYEVIKFTLEYQKQCDLYSDFIVENLEITNSMSDTINISELYDEFKIWYENTFSNHKYPSKIEFKEYLKKRYTSKKVTQNEIRGFKLKVKNEGIDLDKQDISFFNKKQSVEEIKETIIENVKKEILQETMEELKQSQLQIQKNDEISNEIDNLSQTNNVAQSSDKSVFGY